MSLRRISAVLAASAAGVLLTAALAPAAHASDPKNSEQTTGCPTGSVTQKDVHISDQNGVVTADARFYAYNSPGGGSRHCIEVTPGEFFDPAEAYLEMWVCTDDYRQCNGRSVATTDRASGELESGTQCRVVLGLWGTDYPPLKVSEACSDPQAEEETE